jgi:hypothetical protein
MWNETVTLFIDDTSIRLTVVQGQKVKKWAELKLEPGLVKGSAVIKEPEVSAKIKQITQSQKVGSKKIILGFSGLHSLTRPATLPQLPKSMIPEAVAREARRVLPVPLDQVYLNWCKLPGQKDKIQVFMTAIPRKTADSLVRVVRGAGLEPSVMAIKPLVLTKTLKEKAAILVDVQPAEFDIVIVTDGVPQPIRTLTFPEEEISWEQKLEMIISDIDRTIKFFDTNNPEKPMPESVPIYISGDLQGKPELCKVLSEKLGHPFKILTPILKGLDQIDTMRYMVNLAMATKSSKSALDITFSIADMNLLPAPYQPKPMSLTKAIGIPGAIAVAGLVIPMVLMIQSASSSISAKQTELDITSQTINQRTVQKLELSKSVTELENKVSAIRKDNDNLTSVLDSIITRQEYVRGDLRLVLGSLTPSVTLKSISESDETVTLTGTAPNKQDIYTYAQAILQYARTLDLSDRYAQTIVSSLKTSSESQTVSEAGEGEEGQEPQLDETLEFTLTFERKA